MNATSRPASCASNSQHGSDVANVCCASCGSRMDGRYCSNCGEERPDQHALSVSHFLWHTILHEFVHLDGKPWLTLKYLMFRPGFLATEYFAGRRKRYIRPVRLLLIALLAFAVLGPTNTNVSWQIGKLRLSMLPPGPPSHSSIEDTVAKLDVFGILKRQLASKQQRLLESGRPGIASDATAEKFDHELKRYGTALSFCNVILVSLLLFLLLRRRRPYWIEHLVFSLHLAAFLLLFSIALSAVMRVATATLGKGTRLTTGLAITMIIIILMAISAQVIYLFCALKRFYYGEHSNVAHVRWRAAGLVVIAHVGNSVFLTAAYLAGASIAIMRL